MVKRLKVKGLRVFYHVMTRTAQQEYYLTDPEMKAYFEKLLSFFGQIYFVKILSYTVLSNHYHIALEINAPEMDVADIQRRYELAQTRLKRPRKWHEARADHFYERYTNLSMFMWEINHAMAVTHNKRKETKGHLWGGRFKSVVVENGQALLNVMAYIELNAVRANLVSDPADFYNSSVGHIKADLDAGKTPKAPPIDCMNALPEAIRATTYLAWIRYVALTCIDPSLGKQKVPLQFTASGWSVEMGAIIEALATRAPADWGCSAYGTKAFSRKALIGAGRLIPLIPEKPAREGPPKQGTTTEVA